MDDEVDILHGEIVTYLGEISQKPLSAKQTRDFLHLMDAVNDLENIGDIIETDLVALGNKRIQEGFTVSAATEKVLRRIHDAVAKTVDAALYALMENDPQAAREVIAMKGEINRLVEAASRHQAERLVVDEPNRLAAYQVEIDVIEKLKRIYYFAKRMARVVVPPVVVAEKSGM
jgi:phosphate:Na+ symporter